MCRNPSGILLAGMLVALVLCCLASCGRSKIEQIDDAVQADDLEKAKTMIKDNPELVFSKAKDSDPATPEHPGWTPLHFAAHYGHKDVVKWLLANNLQKHSR